MSLSRSILETARMERELDYLPRLIEHMQGLGRKDLGRTAFRGGILQCIIPYRVRVKENEDNMLAFVPAGYVEKYHELMHKFDEVLHSFDVTWPTPNLR